MPKVLILFTMLYAIGVSAACDDCGERGAYCGAKPPGYCCPGLACRYHGGETYKCES